MVDKYDTKKTAMTALAPLFLLLIVLITFEGEFFLIIYMSLFGLTMGIGRPFIGSLWAEIYGVESLGTVKALLHAGAVFASALSPLVFGYLIAVSYTHLRAHETDSYLVCRLLLEKKPKKI